MVLQPEGLGPQTDTEMVARKVLPALLFFKGFVDTECFSAISREVATRLVKLPPSSEIPLAGMEPLQLNMKFVLLIIHLCTIVESQIVRDRNEYKQKHAD